ncbi:MAG: gliding motility-associated C-terminal domain-containing protein [Crocinitomicaceae bacterium]
MNSLIYRSIRSKINILLLVGSAFLIHSFSFGQSSAPAGVNLGALQFWVDGSDPGNDGTLPAAGSIVVWEDKSGNGADLSVPMGPGTPGDPYYEPTISEFNGAGGFVFDSTDIFRFNIGTDWTGDHTIFIVFAQDTVVTQAGTALFSSGDNLNDQFEIQVENGLTNYTYHTTSGGGGSTVTESDFGPQSAALGTAMMYSATRSMDSVTCFMNGMFASGMTTTTGDEFDEYVLNINRQENVLGNNCKIAEVIIYNTVLSPNEMTRINNYLACKYALPIATVTPGGIDPCDVALWMKADAGLETTGLDVDAWIDQSPSGFSGAPGIAGQEPSFNAQDNNFNPSLAFDTTSQDALLLGAATDDGLNMSSDDFHLYTVAFVDDNIGGTVYADRYCLEENGYLLQFNSVTKTWEFEGGDASGSTYDSNDSVNVATTNTATDYSLVSMKRLGSNYTIKTNDGNEDTGATNTDVNYNSTNTDRWIGRQKESPCTENYFDGNISEIIAVKADLTANEDIQIQSYLGLKYGLTLDTSITMNYLSSSGTVIWDNTLSNYWNDVAGIARDDGSMLDQKISKSQDESAIVTIATDADFLTPNTDISRTSLSDGQFLIWGNDNDLASGGWTTAQAPTGFAVLPQSWLVQESGAPGDVTVQVHVDNPNNNIPTFFGNLHLSYGPNPTAATPVEMALDSAGYWSVSGINFANDDYFTFAVKNEFFVEFTSPSSNSIDETYLGASFTTVVDSGIVNIPTWYAVTTSTTGSGTGFATQGDDYSFDNDTILVPVGDYSTLTAPMFDTTSMLIDDLIIEGAEQVEFTFITTEVAVSTGDANNSGGTIGDHDLTITDDDAFNVSIEKVDDGEENDAATGDARFRVYLNGGANSATITGDISWAGGTATGGAPNPGVTDFDDAVSDFTFNPGDTEVLINLSTGQASYNDNLLEGTETIIGTISNINSSIGQAVVANATDTAFITDDEVTGVSISIDTVSGFGSTVEESPTPLSFRIIIDGGVANNSGVPIEGTITYAASTATPGAGNDFLTVTNFSILDGDASTTFDISGLLDNLVENTETVVPEIAITSGPGTVNGSANTAIGFIADEDTTGLTISIGTVGSINAVTEGVATPTIDYVVSLDNSKINGTGSDITGTISLYSNNTTAANFVDYNNNGITDFAIPNGMNSGTYSITLVNDTIPETTDSLTAEIMSTAIGSPSASNSIDLAIFDDDSGLTVIQIGSPTDTTESINGTPFVSFEVSIVAGGAAASDLTGTIGYGTGPGTATAGVDFIPETSYTIPAGDLSVTVQVDLIDDFDIESDENVVANLTGTAPLGNYGNQSSTAVIFDDDGANLEIVIDTVMSGTEGSSDVQFVVSIFGSIPNGSGSPITGNVSYGGTASSGDFSAPTSYEIPVGESSDTITLTIDDDDLLEYTETVYCLLDSNSLSLGTVFIDSALAYIHDNDLDSLSISLTTPVDGAEGGADVSFTISIDGGYVNGLGVPIAGDLIFGGDAVATEDFNNFASYSIPDGATFFIRDLPVIDDQSLELQEFVTATMANPLIPGTENPNFLTDTAYIDDNDLANAELQITAADGVEMPNPHHPIFTVGFVGGLQNETGAPISGVITISGQSTATDGVDYTGSYAFSILNDSIEDRITFDLFDDLDIEGEETIITTISNPTPSIVTIGAQNTATAKILDDDVDIDNDGLSDLVDPIVGNIDSDCDGIFDGCDADADGDGLLDDGGIDLTNNGNPDVFYELYSIDTDLDGIKDTCDADADGDGIIENGPDENEDELNDIHWPIADNDLDLLPDHVDPNDNNIDSDGDGITDGADADVNGDGILDNGCDDDLDGVHNEADIDNNPGKVDNDGDGIIAEWDMQDELLDGARVNYIVSPNGDNVNDVLVIPGIQVEDRHRLTIFNRFGEPIFVEQDYQNDWYGQINQGNGLAFGAEFVMDGVYFYTLDFENGKDVVRGFIEIRH